MGFDYSKLRGRIVEKCGSQKKFADAIGLSNRSVSLKLNGKLTWKQDEIIRSLHVLDLKEEDVQLYFFKIKVQNI